MKRRDEPIPAFSTGLSHAVMAGLLLYAALPGLGLSGPFHPSPSARSPDVVLAPDALAPRAASPASSASAEAGPSEAPEEWPREQIAQAREQCSHMLASTAADLEWLDPIKKGACGLPAPVLLKSIGSGYTKVVFDPPVQVNCRMVEALGKWVKSTLQPMARERLKSEVVSIVGASGYSCRNIYNRPNARLSQHALANAIDIGGFVLANGRTVRVLKGWGLTARDIQAQAKAKAETAAKAKAAARTKEAAREKKDAKDGSVLGSGSSRIKQASVTPTSLTLGKKPLAVAATADDAAEPKKPTKEALFLRAIHGGACREFGTVLGPEANDPHRNHFHLDLIPRRRGYCE